MTSLRLVQFDAGAGPAVAALRDDGAAHVVNGARSTYDLAWGAIAAGCSLHDRIATVGLGAAVDVRDLLTRGQIAAPIAHPSDTAHLLLTGTGLTHLGSAQGRDKMHRKPDAAATVTDSVRMFQLGVDGGKPAPGQIGVQPEWFYKGDGSMLTAPGAPLCMPAWSLDGGEEPEIAAVYLIGPDGTPWRLGHALGNEFSDHVTERGNYLWLAHSKLRAAALGPELLLGALPAAVHGTSRIMRDDAVLWEKPFLSGEANMSHSLSNLEHHHFKYPLFRRPGDVHVHFFGTATLSFSDNIRTQPGDVFEIEAAPFILPLRNRFAVDPAAPAVPVRAL